MLQIYRFAELTPDLRQDLIQRANDEFADVVIVREIEWAEPDWTCIWQVDGVVAAFYHVVDRHIVVDGERFRAAGVNNVITAKAFRGRGYASRMLQESEAFLYEDVKFDLGLLLCADTLIPFYEKLGWYTTDGALYFEQQNGKKRWSSNAMLRTKRSQIAPREIDLLGKPW